MSAVRGPSGVAPFPPASLASTKLPIDILPAETPLYRAHPTTHGPIFFGPGPGAPATYRFDSASGAFGVLYVALGLAAALVETLLRNPRRKMVALADIEMRATSVLRCRRDLQVVRLHGAGCRSSASTIPSRRGLTNRAAPVPTRSGRIRRRRTASPSAPGTIPTRSASRFSSVLRRRLTPIRPCDSSTGFARSPIS